MVYGVISIRTNPNIFWVVASSGKDDHHGDYGGVVHTQFLKNGNNVSNDRYMITLQKLRAKMLCVLLCKCAILQRNNARPHTSQHNKVNEYWRVSNSVTFYRTHHTAHFFLFFPKLKRTLQLTPLRVWDASNCAYLAVGEDQIFLPQRDATTNPTLAFVCGPEW